MRLVFVPEELTPLHLLELGGIPQVLTTMLQEKVRAQFEKGLYEETLTLIDRVLSAAWSDGNRYTAALALLYKADYLRRLQRWEDALQQTQRASNWLRMYVTQVADYNEGVASYVEGLIHYLLRADDRAIQRFLRAQELLVQGERYWGFEGNASRVEDCQNVIRWIKDLLALQDQVPPGELGMIVPVYELVNQSLIRTGALPILPFQIMIPKEVLSEHLPSRFVPLQVDTLPFIQLQLQVNYVALRVLEDEQWVRESRAGDVLLVEVISPGLLTTGVAVSTDQPFIRRMDGRVAFRPRKSPAGFEGIPRVLIRESEEDDL